MYVPASKTPPTLDNSKSHTKWWAGVRKSVLAEGMQVQFLSGVERQGPAWRQGMNTLLSEAGSTEPIGW